MIGKEFKFIGPYGWLSKIKVIKKVKSKYRNRIKYVCQAFNEDTGEWEHYGIFNRKTLKDAKGNTVIVDFVK